MKSFVIILVCLVGGMIWLKEWASSGKMDAFIEQHEDRDSTPGLLFVMGEACHTAKSPENASRYYKWIIDKYPEMKFMPRVRFHLAQNYEEMGMRREAMDQYIVLKDSYPLTDYGEMARKKWETTRF